MKNRFPALPLALAAICVCRPIVVGVPEPSQVAASLLLLAGVGGYVFMKRRKAAKIATRVAA
jgi:hypothetical protein